jgi:uncharacterized protein YcbX
MAPVPPAVAWISVTPVKGLRIEHRDEVQLGESGVPGDRAFFLVDERDELVSATRLGPLVAVLPRHDARAGTLELRFPNGETVGAAIELGPPEPVGFYGEPVCGRPVRGPFSEALSVHCATRLRLMAAPPERSGLDRGPDGAATLLSVAALERLRREAATADAIDAIDARRFRMTFGIDGIDAHEEDTWIGRDVRIGEALVRVLGNVGRCALTTRDPETGVVDLKTLHHLKAYRDRVATTEPLPFGVHARVLQPGRVRLGDGVAVNGAVPADARRG